MNKVLTLKNVYKNYQQGQLNIEVLKGINLSIATGETIAIIGSSGSGKSTLLHIAGLLDKADGGEVIITDLSEKTLTIKAKDMMRLNYIGFIYQYHHLLRDFSARENVALPKLIAGKNYKAALEEADQLLLRLALIDKNNNLPGELSGGEQQRVAIARALINNPKIVLADEPTGNLDPHTAEEVLKLFLETASELGTAIVMVTHNYNLAKKMKKQYALKDGILFQLFEESA